MSSKVWENVGFACGGLAVALLLLFAGVIGSAGDGSPGVLVVALVLAVLCALAFVRSTRAKGRG